MLELNLVKECKCGYGKKDFLELFEKFEKVLEARIEEMMGKRGGDVTLVLCDDEYIHKLNKEYRSKDKPTDVISFAYLEVTDFEVVDGDVAAGDIFISLDTARRQAKEKGHSLKRELEILFVHGLLHCFGFDHRNDEEEAEMEGWAAKVLG